MLEQFIRNARGDFGSVAPAQRVLISNNHATGLGHRGSNRLPIEWVQGAQVDKFHLESLLAIKPVHRLQSAWNNRAIGDHREIASGMYHLRLAEGNHVIPPGIRRPAVALTIEPLMLEEQHRIVATDRSSQQ